jgi:mannosyltransferase
VSSVPTGQRGQSSPSDGTDGPELDGTELDGTGSDRTELAGAGGLAGTGPAAPRARWRAGAGWYLPAALAAAVMAVLGVWGLARDSSMGNDEVATRWAALLSLHQLAHLLRHVDAVHGLYYLLMHGWMAVGTSPAAMRIPSVIAMVVAVALIVIIGRRLTGSGWAGLFAGLIVALTPTISYYAQTARSYALVFACVAGSTLALLHVLAAEARTGEAKTRAAKTRAASAAEDEASRARPAVFRYLVYAVLLIVGGYLNELSLLVVAAHAVTVLLARYGRRVTIRWAAAAAVSVIVVLPLAALSAREDAAVAWIPRPGLWSLRILFHDYFGATTAVAVLLFCCAVAAVLPPLHGGRRAPGPGWWSQGGVSLPSVAAPLLVVPGALLILESLAARPLYVDRYVLYGEAGAALLAGAGALRIGRWLAGVTDRRMLLWVPGVVVCAAALVLQLAPQQRVRTPQSRLFDFGGPSRYLAAHARPGDGVLFFSNFYRKARLGYPADYRNVSDFAMAQSPAAAGNFQGRDKPVGTVQSLMTGYQRIWVVGRSPFAHLTAGPVRAEDAVLTSHFSLAAQRHFKGIFVTLWVRR